MRAKGYLVVLERSKTGWGAYVPQLTGLGAAAPTRREIKKLIREAVEFHLDGMRQNGDLIPMPNKS